MSSRSRRLFPGWLAAGGVWAGSLALAGWLAVASTPAAAQAKAPMASATGPGPAAPAANTSATPIAAAPARPAATAPKDGPPFDEVVKDAVKSEGLLTVWRKEEKFWLELKPADLQRLWFFSPKIARGLGEARLYGGTLVNGLGGFGRAQVARWQRVGPQLRLVAVNPSYLAAPGTPQALAVAAAFSPSLLASAPLASAPHPQSQAVLVDVSQLFLGDLLGLGMALNRTYRQSYALDTRHSQVERVRSKPDALVVEVSQHYASANLASPGSPGSMASLPDTLPDARSLFLGLLYGLSPLPETPMPPRRADPRLGHFSTTVLDFGQELSRRPEQRFVNRWRLEKRDPQAALSPPVKPLVFWLDRTVPQAYRESLRQGVLAWNTAFERIGFQDALQVREQPADADFDTLDPGVASLRWMTNADTSFGAIGPTHVDPRSGEILDADIALESLSTRSNRFLRASVLKPSAPIDWLALLQARDAWREAQPPPGAVAPDAGVRHEHDECQHADRAAEQLALALETAGPLGDLPPDDPRVEAFVQAYLKEVTLHEVGHVLGLRHNFRASTWLSEADLADPSVTAQRGLLGSVMDYAALNLALPGQPPRQAFQDRLGPYDFWAIEYAYKPIAPDQEQAELLKLAARSPEPGLGYGSDDDAALGIDPEVLQFDLGSDPLAFARHRLAWGQAVVAQQITRPLAADESYAKLRRSLGYVLRDSARALGGVVRQIGGLRTLRDFAGSGRDPLQPVPPERQREALDFVLTQALAADAWRLPADLQRKLAPDFFDRADPPAGATVGTDYRFEDLVQGLRASLLSQLLSEGLLQRLQDQRSKWSPGEQGWSVEAYLQQLRQGLWRELAQPAREVPAFRQALQAQHVARLVSTVLQGSAWTSGTASSWQVRRALRQEADILHQQLRTALRQKTWPPGSRAHWRELQGQLQQALKAPVVRTAG